MNWKLSGESIFMLLSDKKLKTKRRDEAIIELLKVTFA